ITVDLHLPFFDRKEWKRRIESNEQLDVSTTTDGRILVYSTEAHELITAGSTQSDLALAAVFGPPDKRKSSLRYTGTQTLDPARVRPALDPILRAYHFPETSLEITGDVPVDVTL